MASPATALQQAQAANNFAAAAILSRAVPASNPIFSQTIVPANQQTVSIPLQNVGLQRGLLIKVVATLANASGGVVTLSAVGAPNILSNVVFSDYANYRRVDTTGAHLFLIDCIKRRQIYGAAYSNDNPKFSSNWAPIVAPATIANGASGTVIMYYYVPIAYLDDDFRGAIFSNITSATMNLAFTFNASPGVAGGVDASNAVYTGGAVTITTATVTVFQEYYDQIPTSNGALLLPSFDMQTMYEMKWSPFPNIAANVETPLPYTNQRDYLSTVLYYNSFPTPALGTDISSIRLVAANTYQWWKADPLTVALRSRLLLGSDAPAGFYILDSRKKPISTVQWGNMALGLTPSVANVGAYANVFFENFAQIATIGGAQSIAA